jgi:hypothetical protein
MFPANWSERDRDLAVQLGITVLTELKRQDQASETSFLEKVRDAITFDLQKTIEENSSLKQKTVQAELDFERRLATVREETAARVRADLREQIVLADTQARCLSQALVTQAEPKDRGAKFEGEIANICVAEGLFVTDTSRGVHVDLFHDLLVSRTPLDVHGTPPTYSGAGTICSVECKCHKSAKNMNSEITKFARQRSQLLSTDRAQCFVFIASTPIPHRQRRRKSIEVLQVDGRVSVTSWLGADDLTDEEIAHAIADCIEIQETISKSSHKEPENYELKPILETLYEALSEAEELQETISKLCTHKDRIRLRTLELLLRIYSVAQPNIDSDSALETALKSLAQPQRIATDKLIKNASEHKHLKRELKRKR